MMKFEISRELRDSAMRAIIDFYTSCQSGAFISAKFLERIDTLQNVDINRLLSYLCAKDLITLEQVVPNLKAIRLTDKGKTYFEDQQDAAEKTRSERLHDWLIAIFSALAGALASEPLWNLLHKIF